MTMIRKATAADLSAVESIYNEIHDAEEKGLITTGWLKGIYPVRAVAESALQRDDLFVMEEDGILCGAALINQIQVDVYAGAPWKQDVPDDQVCVLHTLVISPKANGRGLGNDLFSSMRIMPAETEFRSCGWIRTRETQGPGQCTGSLGTRRSALFRLCSTGSRMSIWCCLKSTWGEGFS